MGVMGTKAGTLTLRLGSDEAEVVQKALAARQRANLLDLLVGRKMNIMELSEGLGISQTTVSAHVRILEKAGLVGSEYTITDTGAEKRCWAKYDNILFQTGPFPSGTTEHSEEASMPVGLFTAAHLVPSCGMATDTEMIELHRDAQRLFGAERARAQMLWLAGGWLEYTFPCTLVENADITAVEFSAEICSEAPLFNNDFLSDITLWINGMEIGTWTSPGDFGGQSGRLNPAWWNSDWSQYGMLKQWSVDEQGSSIDETPCGATRVSDLGIKRGDTVVVRIGEKDGAANKGGMNLFGHRFGNYPQDLILRYRYLPRPRV